MATKAISDSVGCRDFNAINKLFVAQLLSHGQLVANNRHRWRDDRSHHDGNHNVFSQADSSHIAVAVSHPEKVEYN
jgi:hypothetical protein